MDRRPDPQRNGKSEQNGNGSYPIVETRRIVQPRTYPSRAPSLLPLVVLCLAVGLAAAVFMQSIRQPKSPEAVSNTEAFRLGVNRAMSAAELTQTARSPKEWQQVASWWKEAVQLMQAVPVADANHQIAQTKIAEYQNNFQYAEGQSKAAPKQSVGDNLWGVGSRRALVIKIQGEPISIDRYDAICKEVLYYDKSQVELNNGIVVNYEDFDHKLKAVPPGTPLPKPTNSTTWDLGSTKEAVFKIQGTPTRVVNYDYSERETLYYGGSTVEIAKQQVIGYRNEGGNLRVRTVPIDSNPTPGNVWTLASSREDVLQVQGTPTEVRLEPSSCTETLYYGNSTVVLKNGFISGYDNFDNNLRVKAK